MDKYIGKMLDNRYEVLQILGTGGMAVVYKARCHRLNRLVAVKILKDEFASDAEFRRRFHAESQAVAMLSHPNIVSVYDVSRSSDLEYIVMELIDGITLKQYIQKKGVLNWREALHFTNQMVKALSHFHSRGIIHRDIKPHNIMILRDGSIKVADFGIARFTAKQNTLTQEALGSVHYISPEQARGSNIDARSDLYSVGVVMYEMLTDRLPYEGDSPVSVAIQHINSMPLSPRDINPEIPEALEKITMKAMSANVTRRYLSAEDMLHDLEEFRKNPDIQFDFRPREVARTQPDNDPTQKINTVQHERAMKKNGEQNVKENGEKRKRSSTLTVIAGVAAILVFVGGMGILLVNLIGGVGPFVVSSPEPTQELETPNLLNKTLEEARALYPEYDIVEKDSVYSDDHEAGRIISQTPQAGREIKPEGTISVTVSRGVEMVEIPNLTNVEYRRAGTMIEQLGLVLRKEEFEVSDEMVKDYVIRTIPEKGTMVRKGEPVTLIVSLGPERKTTRVPNVVDLMEDEARRRIENAGLQVGDVREVESSVEKGRVVWQSEPATTEVYEKTFIDLQISLGPPPSEEPEPSEEPTAEPPPPSEEPHVEEPSLPPEED